MSNYDAWTSVSKARSAWSGSCRNSTSVARRWSSNTPRTSRNWLNRRWLGTRPRNRSEQITLLLCQYLSLSLSLCLLICLCLFPSVLLSVSVDEYGSVCVFVPSANFRGHCLTKNSSLETKDIVVNVVYMSCSSGTGHCSSLSFAHCFVIHV